MKHLKKYENLYNNNSLDYDINDYVLIKYNKDTDSWTGVSEIIIKYGNFAKIDDIDNEDKIQPYYVVLPSNIYTWLHEDEIERKLNKKEIEEFEFVRSTYIYNL